MLSDACGLNTMELLVFKALYCIASNFRGTQYLRISAFKNFVEKISADQGFR